MERLFSVEEAARQLGGLSKWTVHAWLAKGGLIRTKLLAVVAFTLFFGALGHAQSGWDAPPPYANLWPILCADSSGSGTAQSCTSRLSMTPTVPDCIIYTTTTANTGSGLTVNVDSSSAYSVAVPGPSGWTTSLTPGIIPANEPIPFCIDAANHWDAMQTGTLAAGSYQPSYLPFPPAATAFTWVNQGSATDSDNGNQLALTIPYTSALNWRLMTKSTAYSTPWSVSAYWRSQQQAASATDSGLYLYDGTKMLGIELLYVNSSPYVALRVERITNVTTDDATEATIDIGFYAAAPGTNGVAMPIQTNGGLYVRWRDNGTNLYADYSLDGSNWTNFYSEAVGAFITPTAYGFGGIQEASGGAQYPTIIDLMGWLETNSASL